LHAEASPQESQSIGILPAGLCVRALRASEIYGRQAGFSLD
jgi:hypothetical protein